MTEEEVYEAQAERENEIQEKINSMFPHRDGEPEIIAEYRYWFFMGAYWADQHPCKYPFLAQLDKSCRYIRQFIGEDFDEHMEDYCREMSRI